MADFPSYKGIGSSKPTVLRITPKKEETRVTTNKPVTTTPSPRGHA